MDETTTTPVAEEEVQPSTIGGVQVDEHGNAIAGDLETQTQAEPEVIEAEVANEDPTTAKVEVSTSDAETKALTDWAAKKGLATDDMSPATIQALKLARETEKQYHSGQQKQSELKKAFESARFEYPQAPQAPAAEYDPYAEEQTTQPQNTGIDPRDLRLAMVEFQQNHRDYEQGTDLDQAMGNIVAQNPTFWMNNLDQAYSIAQANLSEATFTSRLEAAREEARLEERERLTKKSRSTSPQAQATGGSQADSFTKITSKNVEAFINTSTQAEYTKRINEVNAALR